MPLPNRRRGEKESKFISRCMSELSKKGEGKSRSQRFAICKTRASISLNDEEFEILGALAREAMNLPEPQDGDKITNLNPRKKKKRKDKFRITKEDGSGTDI